MKAQSIRPGLFKIRHRFRLILLGCGTVTIGRRQTCDYVLKHRLVSREHARLVITEHTAAVEDMGSVNGVLVNGERIHRTTRVNPGDVITLGEEQLEIVGFADDGSVASEQSEMTFIGRNAVVPSSDDEPIEPEDEDWDTEMPTMYGDAPRT